MIEFFFLIASIFLVVKSSDYAIKYASNLAHILRLPTYFIGFIIVAVISILPETLILINSAFQGIPSFGLATLFGSNIADLTFVFAVLAFFTIGGIRVSSLVLESNKWYPFFLALPIFVGIDGRYSRPEGVLLIISGVIFYYFTFKSHCVRVGKEENLNNNTNNLKEGFKNFSYLALSMVFLLFGAHLTVKYGVSFAESIKINPVIVGMLFVGLGTCLPELVFSLKAIKNKNNCLAFGDILGTVISDATIALGVVALIKPFSFPIKTIYVTAVFMVFASLLLFYFMRSGKILTKKEALLLLSFYIIFILVEYIINSF